MKISQVLERAAKLVERGWHRGWLAVDAKGREIGPRDRGVVAVCLIGSIQRVTGPLDPERNGAFGFLNAFLEVDGLLAIWNDAPGRTGPEVACWLSSASEYAKVRGK